MFIQGAQSLSVFVCLFLSTSKHPHDEAIIVTVHCLYQEFYNCVTVTAQVPHTVLAAGAEVPGHGAALRAAALPQERGVQAGGVQGHYHHYYHHYHQGGAPQRGDTDLAQDRQLSLHLPCQAPAMLPQDPPIPRAGNLSCFHNDDLVLMP